MAKTGDAPDRKPKAKPRARGARPSFAQTAAPAAGSAWVYRSDAPAAPAAKAAAPVAAVPVAAAPVVKAAVKGAVKDAVKPVAKPIGKPAATVARGATAKARAPIAAAPAPGSSRMVHALDVVTWPIAVSLLAVLAPMRRLLGPSSR